MWKNDKNVLTDSAIVDGFLEGNQECFLFIRSWIDEIIQRCLWIEQIDPNDLRSDTEYKLLINFRTNQFHNKSALKAYVQKITRNTLIDAVRRRRNQPLRLQIDPVSPDDPIDTVIKKEEISIFERIFDLIDSKCRDLWKMIFYDRLSYKKIAEIHQVKDSTIKIRVYRCKEEAIKIFKRIS
ncbi:MAG: RNA polymerase sigma factor [Ignavibacteriales bacterium]|nr:RNA polymerase sigma factor [Ignavibacteriales bacterium]